LRPLHNVASEDEIRKNRRGSRFYWCKWACWAGF